MTAPELKPCPFCGSEVTIKRETHIGWIKCTNPHSICIGSGLGFAFISGDEETAIAAWNTRTASIPTPVADLMSNLEGFLAHKPDCKWWDLATCTCGLDITLSARPTDTRVVTVAQLDQWAVYLFEEYPAETKEIRAIIGGQANE
jgi:hypothetical protein